MDYERKVVSVRSNPGSGWYSTKAKILSRISGFIPVVLLVVLLGGLGVGASSPAPVSYVARRDFALAQAPVGVAEGDFNKDGKPDLVLVNQTAGNVSVLLGNGDGTFQAAVNYTVTANPISVAVTDTNNDGNLDVVVVSQGNTPGTGSVSVLLGNGDGTFQTPTVTNFPSSIEPSKSLPLLVGDFNADGKLDLAFIVQTPSSQWEVAVMLGNGDGSFQAPQLQVVNGQVEGLGIGDFNGDGKLDVVLTLYSSGSNDLAVFPGKGDGTFGTPINNTEPSFVGQIAVGDFNGDGKADVAAVEVLATDELPALNILLGNGDGTFQNFAVYKLSNYDAAVGVLTGDVNGDGVADVVMIARQGGVGPDQILVFTGKGGGTFDPSAALGTSGASAGVVIADFNGDGKADIVSADDINGAAAPGVGGEISETLGDGDGTFQVTPTLPSLPQNYVAPGPIAETGTGDFNGDGKPDIIFPVETVQIPFASAAVWLANGNGTFAAPVLTDPNTCGGSPIAIGDFNHDGKADVAALNESVLNVCLGNGDGTFQPETSYDAGVAQFPAVAVADFNGDGKPDLVENGTTTGPFGLIVLLGNGDGTFGFAKGTSLTHDPSEIATGDFNNDGKIDVASVVEANPTGTALAVFPGNGDGTFSTEIDTAFTPPSGYRFVPTNGIAAGDFNGDGKLDVALLLTSTLVNAPPDQVAVLLGNGDGTFQTPVYYPVGYGASAIGTSDLNGDKVLDLAVENAYSNDVSVLLGNGDGTFQTMPFAWGTQTNGSIAFGDFDGDGAAEQDMAVGTSLLLKQAPTTSVAISANQLNFGNQFVGVASIPQTVTITNNGASSLSIFGISIAGTNASEFTQTDNCPATLAPAGTCTANVTMTAASAGTTAQTATLNIADDANGSPQMVSLSGSGIDFQLTASSNSSTVNPGQTATYTLNLAPLGNPNSNTVNFTCSGAPATTTCSVSPTSATLQTIGTVTVTVTTTAGSLLPPTTIWPQPLGSHPEMIAAAALLMLISIFLYRGEWRRRRVGQAFLLFAGALVLSLGIAACGGGNSSSNNGSGGGSGGGGTPAGTYSLTVRGASGGDSHSVTLSLTVN